MEKFSPVGEKVITRAIVSEFTKQFNEYVESDCIIVGGGPSGLVAGRNIARAGKKVVIIERNNYLGGGFWSGGYLMPKVTVRHPGERVLDELGVPYKVVSEGLVVCDAPHACASLIASACDAGVKIFNMTMLEDLLRHSSIELTRAQDTKPYTGMEWITITALLQLASTSTN